MHDSVCTPKMRVRDFLLRIHQVLIVSGQLSIFAVLQEFNAKL